MAMIMTISHHLFVAALNGNGDAQTKTAPAPRRRSTKTLTEPTAKQRAAQTAEPWMDYPFARSLTARFAE